MKGFHKYGLLINKFVNIPWKKISGRNLPLSCGVSLVVLHMEGLGDIPID